MENSSLNIKHISIVYIIHIFILYTSIIYKYSPVVRKKCICYVESSVLSEAFNTTRALHGPIIMSLRWTRAGLVFF